MVTLKKNSLRWSKLPAQMKVAIVAGVDRVGRIRSDIARTARVTSMPFVQVVDVAWVAPGMTGAVHGRATPLRFGASYTPAVELAAPTVVFTSDSELRGVLLHEFSHCFNLAKEALAAEAAGLKKLDREPPSGSLYDAQGEEWDRQKLEPPGDWFSDDDAALFPYQHDALLDACTEAIAHRWIIPGLPAIEPPTAPTAKGIEIPFDWVKHIRALNERK